MLRALIKQFCDAGATHHRKHNTEKHYRGRFRHGNQLNIIKKKYRLRREGAVLKNNPFEVRPIGHAQIAE